MRCDRWRGSAVLLDRSDGDAERAGAHVRGERRADVREHDVVQRGDAVAQLLHQGHLPRRRCHPGDGDVHLLLTRMLHCEVEEFVQCPLTAAYFRQRRYFAVLHGQDGLDGERIAEQGGGRADATTSAEIFQCVDVEELLAGKTATSGYFHDALWPGARRRRACGGQHGEPEAHAGGGAVDDVDGDAYLSCGFSGRVRGGRETTGDVEADDGVGARADGVLEGPEERPRVRGSGGDRFPRTQGLDQFRPVEARFVVNLPVCLNLELDDRYPPLGG